MKHIFYTTAALSLGLCAAGCGKKKSSTDPTTTTSTAGGGSTTATGPTNSMASATSLSDLHISSALAFAIPSGLTGKASSSLALADAGKSQEACELGETTKSATDALKQVGELFCHFEVEKAKIKFGHKYQIGSGDDAMALWIDDSKIAQGEMNIYQCENGSKNRNKVHLTGITSSGAAGTITRGGTYSGNAYEETVTFDAGYTTSTRTFVADNAKNSDSKGNTFRRLVTLDLSDGGVSKVYVSNKGSQDTQTFAQAAAVFTDGTYGAALFNDQFSNGSVNQNSVTRAYFDKLGNVVAQTASPTLEAGGTLAIANSDMPGFLTSDLTGTAFPDSDWDCKSGVEAIDIDTSSAAHQACETNSGRDHTNRDCWGSGYNRGTQDNDFKASDAKDPAKLETPTGT